MTSMYHTDNLVVNVCFSSSASSTPMAPISISSQPVPSQTQMRNLDLSFLPKCRNIIQIRTPIHMLPSWNSNIHANLKEVGQAIFFGTDEKTPSGVSGGIHRSRAGVSPSRLPLLWVRVGLEFAVPAVLPVTCVSASVCFHDLVEMVLSLELLVLAFFRACSPVPLCYTSDRHAGPPTHVLPRAGDGPGDTNNALIDLLK